MAAWWPRVSFCRLGRRFSRWPRHAAGFSPDLCPLALAAFRTRSMRPRRREAVSVFVVQIGLSTPRTSSVVITSTGMGRNGAAYSKRHRPLSLVLLISEALALLGDNLICQLAERRDALVLFALGDRVDAAAREPSARHRLLAGLGEFDFGIAA